MPLTESRLFLGQVSWGPFRAVPFLFLISVSVPVLNTRNTYNGLQRAKDASLSLPMRDAEVLVALPRRGLMACFYGTTA